jgi:molybdate transport system substrate-binding protein
MTRVLSACCALLLLGPWARGPAGQTPLTVLCSNAFKQVLQDLAPRFEQTTGQRLVVSYGLSTELKRRIDGGAPFDIAVLTPALIDELIAQKKVAAETRTVLARSPLALAMRAGASKSDISTPELLKRRLLGAKSIAYAGEGASAVLFRQVVDRLQLATDLAPKIILTASGEEAREAVASGRAEVSVMPLSEILAQPGVEVLGRFPGELGAYVVMVAGVRAGVTGRQSEALLRFLTSPVAAPVLGAKGMERG